ncbi:MAG TPA: hypothetical protein VLA19_29140 [Herpetosiphonaceae bacterium]|nr:hypothetical protein [Herpetosiphonaceae bacterium]
MDIQLKPGGLFQHVLCFSCGDVIELGYVNAVADGVASPVTSRISGNHVYPHAVVVCRQCVAAGPAGLRARMHAHAERLRSEARILDELANGALAVPAIADWDAQEAAAAAADDMGGGPENYLQN